MLRKQTGKVSTFHFDALLRDGDIVVKYPVLAEGLHMSHPSDAT
jgi:hypothetical protein